MIGLPARNEAAPYYFTYIDRIKNPDILAELESQLGETLEFLRAISEDNSLHRYAPEKWSIRQVWNHVNDTERAFTFRALWFARGFDSPLPSYDQNVSSRAANADDYSWASHLDEFRTVRLATLTLFRNMPDEAWSRTGIASNNSFTVRALAYIIAGHAAHHKSILQTFYL